jgi:hypothetical protein
MVSGENNGGLRHKSRHKPRHELGPLPEKRDWLGAGEYSTSGRYKLVARWWLIKAAERVVPELLQSLHDDVYPEFAGLVPADARIRHFDQLKDKPALRDALLGWAARFHITEKDTWLLGDVVKCLDHWRRSPEDREVLDSKAFKPILVESGFGPAPGSIPFEFRYPGWDPLSTSFEGWCERLRRRFEVKVRVYGKNIRKPFEEAGLDRNPGRVNPEHFKWLALHWFAGLSYEKIHKLHPAGVNDRTAIQKGVARAADIAGLTERIARV